MSATWTVRQSQVDWLTRFFGFEGHVPVFVGTIPGPALGSTVTRNDCEKVFIVIDEEMAVYQAAYVLAHELIHIRQMATRKLFDAIYEAYDARFGYQGNPLEREANSKAMEIVKRGGPNLVVRGGDGG